MEGEGVINIINNRHLIGQMVGNIKVDIKMI